MRNFLTLVFALCLFSSGFSTGVVEDVGLSISEKENIQDYQPEILMSFEVSIDQNLEILERVNLDAVNLETFISQSGVMVPINRAVQLSDLNYNSFIGREDKPPHLFNITNLPLNKIAEPNNLIYLHRMTHSLS